MAPLNTKTCRNGKQKTSVCVNAGLSLTLSRVLLHISQDFLARRFYSSQTSSPPTGPICKEMRRKSFNKYTSSCCWYYMQEWERESGCTRRMQPNGIRLSLSQSRTHLIISINTRTRWRNKRIWSMLFIHPFFCGIVCLLNSLSNDKHIIQRDPDALPNGSIEQKLELLNVVGKTTTSSELK